MQWKIEVLRQSACWSALWTTFLLNFFGKVISEKLCEVLSATASWTACFDLEKCLLKCFGTMLLRKMACWSALWTACLVNCFGNNPFTYNLKFLVFGILHQRGLRTTSNNHPNLFKNGCLQQGCKRSVWIRRCNVKLDLILSLMTESWWDNRFRCKLLH